MSNNFLVLNGIISGSNTFSGSVEVMGTFKLPAVANNAGTTETKILVTDDSGNIRQRNNLSLTGAQGAQGAQGNQGTAGSNGTQGNQGAQGSQGVKGDRPIQTAYDNVVILVVSEPLLFKIPLIYKFCVPPGPVLTAHI